MRSEESGTRARAERGGDATEAARLEGERSSRDRYRSIFLHSPQPMMTYDPATLTLLDANDAAVRQYGYARDDLMKMSATDLWAADAAESARAVLSGEVPRPATTERHRRKDGGSRFVRVGVCGLSSDPRGERLLLVEDVTERVHDDERQATFRRLIDTAPDALVIARQEGEIVLVNTQTERLFGYSRQELVGRSVELLVPDHRRRTKQAIDHEGVFSNATAAAALELHGVRKDGSAFSAEMSSSTLVTEEGVLVSSAIRDIGERKKIEDQRARLAVLVESSADAIIGKTLEGIVTSWNPAATRLFGYSPAEMIGRSINAIIPRDRAVEESEILKHLASGDVERFETVRLHKSGREIHVSVTSSPVRDAAGNLVGASKVVRDITEKRNAELALARAKDAAEAANRELESFSYSVAHDLRAPLRGMSSFAQLLIDTHADSIAAEGRDWLQEIVGNARKMAALIDALLSLARVARSEPRYEVVDLSAVVRAAASRISSTEPHRRVEWIVQDGLTVELDAALARALVENLVGNAWKFTRHVARACIEFGALDASGTRTFLVRDNGAGFDMAMSRRLFGPFQRLHSESEFPGTGIGLATVQRIVHRHGGRVWAEGAVSAGATFYFTLPARASVVP